MREAAVAAARPAREAAQVAEAAASVAAQIDALPDAGRLARVAADAARTAAITSTDAVAMAAVAADAAMRAINETAPRVAQLRALTDLLSHDLHRLAVDLRPTSLDDLGLVAVRAYAETCPTAQVGVRVLVESIGLDEGVTPEQRLPPEVETTLYRIVQEALTNVAKHAVPGGATQVSVTLQRGSSTHVLVTVEDDGPGLDPNEAAHADRLGLVGMRGRAELLGGTLDMESAPGSGTTVYAGIPPHTLPTG